MEVITKTKLEQMGGLYFSNIMEGIDHYPYKVKNCSEEQAIAWFHALAKEYVLYGDFYAGRITEESLSEFKRHLSCEEYRELLMLYKKCSEYKEQEFVLFRPEERELKLLVKISYRGLLFSTFYLIDPVATI